MKLIVCWKKSKTDVLSYRCHVCHFLLKKNNKKKRCFCRKLVHYSCYLADGSLCQWLWSFNLVGSYVFIKMTKKYKLFKHYSIMTVKSTEERKLTGISTRGGKLTGNSTKGFRASGNNTQGMPYMLGKIPSGNSTSGNSMTGQTPTARF